MVLSRVSLLLCATLPRSDAFFKGSGESSESHAILANGDVVPSDVDVDGFDWQQQQGYVAEVEEGMEKACMDYAAINDEVAHGIEANEREREAQGEAIKDDEIDDEEDDEAPAGVDPEAFRDALKEDDLASQEAEEAGRDTFDDLFKGDADYDADDTDDEDAAGDGDSDLQQNEEEEPDDADEGFEQFVRTFYGQFGNESIHLDTTSNESMAEDVGEEDESCAHPLTEDEKQMAKCPPGEYLGHTTPYTKKKRELRLRKALCLAKAKGYRRGVGPENHHYLERGYMSYESTVWPKPHMCRSLPDRSWYLKHKSTMRYRKDRAPEHYTKEVCHKYKIEFRKSWKVASTSFPDYLRCQYNCDWKTPNVDAKVGNGYMVVATVREPIARFVSAANELLERSINKWCPTGKCGDSDGFKYGKGDGSTHDMFMHQTNWYQRVCPASGGYRKAKLKNLVKSMVKDTVCNYYTYASEHLSTQANFVTQNAGHAKAIHRIMKLEKVDEGLEKMRKAATPGSNKKCKLGFKNVKDCKPNSKKLPSTKAFLQELKKDKELLRELCLVYAQDFICFDYNLPWACKGMF